MKTFHIGLTHDFDQILFLREQELCAVLNARDGNGKTATTDRHVVMDFKDVAAEQLLATVDEAQAEHAALELEGVLAARRRLQDHTYGQCRDCDEAIDLGRLSAVPATAYCIACQALHETAPAVSH